MLKLSKSSQSQSHPNIHVGKLLSSMVWIMISLIIFVIRIKLFVSVLLVNFLPRCSTPWSLEHPVNLILNLQMTKLSNSFIHFWSAKKFKGKIKIHVLFCTVFLSTCSLLCSFTVGRILRIEKTISITYSLDVFEKIKPSTRMEFVVWIL